MCQYAYTAVKYLLHYNIVTHYFLLTAGFSQLKAG